jgi:hypothetical protein
MIAAAGSIVGAQAMTFAIPIGSLFLVCLWAYFQRRPTQ